MGTKNENDGKLVATQIKGSDLYYQLIKFKWIEKTSQMYFETASLVPMSNVTVKVTLWLLSLIELDSKST